MKLKIALLFVFIIIVRNSNAQNSNPTNQKHWSFDITPYGLLAFNSTDVGGTRIRQSFSDLVSITDAGFQLAAEAKYKKLHLIFDGTWATLGDSSNDSYLNIDLKIIQNILTFKIGYTVYENFNYDEDEILKGWSLTPNIGAKYWKNEVQLQYSLSFEDDILINDNINQLADWWDLMIGLKSEFFISNKFMLSVNLDIGGFGIGNSSKSAYDFVYLNTFKVSKLISVNAGFRNFKYRRVDASENGNLETNVNVFGPIVGATFSL
ncbi:hypothetical protein [uncultured Algibacter sp.]|uniref:hypothetical protein n=1 Tax=uncultured Algibacter sp. TaxID=298659 RepID=UPI00261F620F|nr:hypothetical protein [uncultured Algibacter sp.]